MKYLLDINILFSGLWSTHSKHAAVRAWLQNKDVVLCPICELGFLRISTHPRALNQTMATAIRVLDQFIKDAKADWIPDDLPGRQSTAKTSDSATDEYLANLASKHGLKLATLDENLSHPSVELVR